MKDLKYIVVILFLFTAGLLTYRVTLSFFSDLGISSGNVLSASAVFPSATPTLTPIATPTPQLADHVVISEVQISGAGGGNTDNDFVEFYNPTTSPFDLNGHRLVKRTGSSPNDTTIKSWTSTAIIPAGGYYLWANSSIAATVGANTSTTVSITASNSIALRFGAEDTGTIVDALSWNSASQSLKEGTEFSPNPGDNQSMERKAYATSTSVTMGLGGSDEFKGNGFDSDDNSTDFYLRSLSQPQNSSSSAEIP